MPYSLHPLRDALADAGDQQYLPSPGDLVVATVLRSTSENFLCSISPYTAPAQLPHLAFFNVTKKSRPQLASGSLVYARVLSAPKFLEPSLVCYNPSSGKADGLGELKGGMVFPVSLAIARRLLMGKAGGVSILEMLGEKLNFEVCVGRNGKVWVESGSIKEMMIVGRALKITDDEVLDLEGQQKLVTKLLR